ncbi:DJ-1/PfpI family protein [Lacticaseibacillus manihotivorans]|jgi:4-methyl-5(b-hydroxyethyl)-thiazole monophosphate biosynthesis|uniref:DJ-1/PfpI domain-containing protein n=2 Tax=Lacticaseibacillus manihotivorans TaxID=88233 RepID=A0A0R1PZX9_9LACO|nr:DJ-1/PfpI family protein [Lacticaseibacillus manihotivorans]KRL37806.1 hypothetical protein FD01_GL002763 [Lacticaseibacillus manihotivorans DSM 13343 = JCM 12514]QFQ91344.1 DJ-1 family protein [Lacticaseibacillus manihotivorans]
MAKILLFLNKGFETMAFSPFVDICGWARNDLDIDIHVTTVGFTKQVMSTFKIPVIVDELITDIDARDYDALPIPGGFEEYDFYDEAFSEPFLELIRQFDKAHKPIASICTGALPIGKSGVLANRRGTTYHLSNGHRQQQLAKYGVHVVNEPLVQDDNIMTSYCPQTAASVGFWLLEQLTDARTARAVKTAMGY